MKIFIQYHHANANRWIYSGYAKAWVHHGFEVEAIESLSQVKTDEDYYLMIMDAMINDDNLNLLEKSKKTFLWVSGNKFPEPWGSHPNWRCPLSSDLIKKINQLPNVIQWTFADNVEKYCGMWSKNITLQPLAFDSLAYSSHIPETYEYDICYIGGLANNGFNEKVEIIKKTLSAFLKTNLKCAFSVNRNIDHDQENYLLNSSKICLNIHDAYQRVLGLDTNERTFKSLGANGLMISDKIDQLNRLFPAIFTSNDEEELVSRALYLTKKDTDEIKSIKLINQRMINQSHTYINRVEKFLSL